MQKGGQQGGPSVSGRALSARMNTWTFPSYVRRHLYIIQSRMAPPPSLSLILSLSSLGDLPQTQPTQVHMVYPASIKSAALRFTWSILLPSRVLPCGSLNEPQNHDSSELGTLGTCPASLTLHGAAELLHWTWGKDNLASKAPVQHMLSSFF